MDENIWLRMVHSVIGPLVIAILQYLLDCKNNLKQKIGHYTIEHERIRMN